MMTAEERKNKRRRRVIDRKRRVRDALAHTKIGYKKKPKKKIDGAGLAKALGTLGGIAKKKWDASKKAEAEKKRMADDKRGFDKDKLKENSKAVSSAPSYPSGMNKGG